MNSDAKNKIESVLRRTVRDKLENYDPETSQMPFHHRLLGRDRYAIFSFLQSMNTTFGTSIWEQVAEILAKSAGYECHRQFRLMGEIDKSTESEITNLHTNMRRGDTEADKEKETELIRKSIKEGRPEKHPDSVVDFYVKIGRQENYFDITSVKPNMKEFSAMKLKLLNWTALRLSQDRGAEVVTRLAVPYNPYEPNPYERWTLKGLYDLKRGEVLVGREFWDFVSGGAVYDDLLLSFQDVGKELRVELDSRFSKFKIP